MENTLKIPVITETPPPVSQPQKERKTPVRRKKTPQIDTLIFTVKGGNKNPFLYSIGKLIYEFFEEETQGLLFNELRFIEKYKAAMLLFPEARQELKGKPVNEIIKKSNIKNYHQ